MRLVIHNRTSGFELREMSSQSKWDCPSFPAQFQIAQNFCSASKPSSAIDCGSTPDLNWHPVTLFRSSVASGGSCRYGIFTIFLLLIDNQFGLIPSRSSALCCPWRVELSADRWDTSVDIFLMLNSKEKEDISIRLYLSLSKRTRYPSSQVTYWFIYNYTFCHHQSRLALCPPLWVTVPGLLSR